LKKKADLLTASANLNGVLATGQITVEVAVEESAFDSKY
jgi:hypothetical protein